MIEDRISEKKIHCSRCIIFLILEFISLKNRRKYISNYRLECSS